MVPVKGVPSTVVWTVCRWRSWTGREFHRRGPIILSVVLLHHL